MDARTFFGEEADGDGGIYDTNFNDNYKLQVFKSEKVISKIPSDTFQPVATYGGLNFPSEFKLVVEDYNRKRNIRKKIHSACSEC